MPLLNLTPEQLEAIQTALTSYRDQKEDNIHELSPDHPEDKEMYESEKHYIGLLNDVIVKTEEVERQIDPKNITANMIDMAEHFAVNHTYRDFEGFADTAQMLRLCKDPDPVSRTYGQYVWDTHRLPPEHVELSRSILLGHLYERADTYQLDDLTYSNIIDLFELVLTFLGARWWSRVDDERLHIAEQSTPTTDGNAADEE